MITFVPSQVKEKVENAIKVLKDNGAIVEEISLEASKDAIKA